ncbi:uncharacterized protein PG986_003681 [Apiospora aurea]|uniref:Glycosyltransferase family 25 protein n=1 Tax=Apiospora aurea TaxID=335848 RepID=A0ABR1QSE3_9PEZI
MALAAAVSNITLEWVEGVDGDRVEERVLPPGDRPKHKSSDAAVRGSWRAHMNALRRVVEEGLSNALIMEDDVDWDLRIKSQLQTFGAASNAWLHMTSDMESWPSNGLGDDPLITYRPRRSGAESLGITSVMDRESEDRHSIPLDHISPASTSPSPDHPYGEGWDVLWLGHCGTDFPDPASSVPHNLRVVVADDPTVPAPRHLKPHPFASHDALGELYPPHTRVVHAASSPGTACTLAYAVSQRGARKLLWQFGLEDFSSQWDLMLGDWCAGGYVDRTTPNGDNTDETKSGHDQNDEAAGTNKNNGLGESSNGNKHGTKGDGERGRRKRQQPTCMTVQPPIFGHYFAKKGASDIRGQGGGYASKIGAPYVRWSLPDEGEAMW